MDNSVGRIPFGQKNDDGRLVDASSVSNGLACNCICPSCDAPLIARQGDKYAWHFAHATRKNSFKKTSDECQYSFYVSVRMMARQLLSEGASLILPGLKLNVADGLVEIEYEVEIEQTVTLNDIKIDQPFMGTIVDVLGKWNNKPFVIYFTHAERPYPKTIYEPSDKTCYILGIKIDDTLNSLPRNEPVTYKSLLCHLLKTDVHSKQWLYHPNHNDATTQAYKKLEDKKKVVHSSIGMVEHKRKQQQIQNSQRELPPSMRDSKGRLAQYWCNECEIHYSDHTLTFNGCSQCGKTSTRSFIEFID